MIPRPPFAEFLDALRGAGFTVTPEHHVRVARLVHGLGGEYSPVRLKTLLCPIIATSDDEQARFYSFFDRLYPLFAHPVAERAREPAQIPGARTKKPEPRVPVWVVLAALLLIGAGIVGVAWLMWPAAADGGGPGGTAAAGGGNITIRPPAPPAPRRQDFHPTTGVSVIPSVWPPPLSDAWRAALLSVVVAFPLYLVYEWLRRRTAIVERRSPKQKRSLLPAHTENVALAILDRARLYQAARHLRRRQPGDVFQMDPSATVAATVSTLGFPQFRYKALTRRPEYLVLIDRLAKRDHQAARFEQLAAALRQEGLIVHAYFYAGDPRICSSVKDGHSVFLAALQQKFAGARLIVLGHGDGLIDPIDGDWSAGARMLFSWRERAVLTPKPPGEWRAREDALLTEFWVLPDTAEGLEDLVGMFEREARQLRTRERRTQEAPKPEAAWRPDTVARYVERLRGYLGPAGFRLLCSCALYPHLQLDLTWRLARALTPEVANEKEIPRLFRLPLFRQGSLPLELQEALSKRLSTAERRAAQAEIQRFLEETAPAEGEVDDAHRLELVVQRWRLGPRDRAAIADDDAMVRLAAAAPDSGLMLRLPEWSRRRIFRHGLPALGLAPAVRSLWAAAAFACLAFVAWPRTADLRLASVLPPLPPSWALELGAEDFYDPQGWTAGLGPFEKPCDPPNPRETFFGRPEKAASPMIELRTASSDVMCCQCASRTRSIPMNRTLRARDAYLYGVFQTDRGPSDTFSVASMQIDLNLRGSRQGSAVFASENRPNNNCAGTDQRPEKLLKGAFSSQILSMIADVEFDEILVRLQGYGCGPASNRVAIALNVRQPGDVAMNPRDGSEYVLIPPGEFEMGCSKDDNECFDDEKPVHRVRISRGFWIGRTEATVAVWNRLAARSDRPGVKGAPREPATSVSWTQAAGHCTAAGGRLPTEAEWEYAARAGTTTARYGNLNEIAWHGSNSGGRVHEVATRAPNAWGLYDMLGNVYEWVADDYRPYEARTQTDPGGPGTGRSKVLRGGSWFNLPRLARASDRYSYDLEYGNVGLRCVWDAGRRFSP